MEEWFMHGKVGVEVDMVDDELQRYRLLQGLDVPLG